jgi:hypothetical protein
MAPTADGHGYWLATTGGGIFSFGDAVAYGSLAAKHLPYQVVQVVATPSGRGYWLALSNGGVYSFGNASFHGSLAAEHMGPSVVAMAATSAGDGYWLATAGGHVYPFGDARSEALDGGNPLRGQVTAMVRTPDGRGYWLATSTGSVYAFGDATFHGSLATEHVLAPVVSLAATADGSGYWLASANGAVHAFGDAKFKGSWTPMPLTGPVVAMSVTPSGHGYWLATSGLTAVPRCQPGELSIAYDRSASSGGAAGSFGMTYRLTDTSSSTCELHGYPGLQLRDQQGKPLPTTTIRSPHGGVPTVTLAPGDHAWFDIEFATQTGFGNLTCPRSTSLAVIPPNEYSHLVVRGTGGELAPYGGTTEDLRCGQIRTSAVLAASPY